MVVESAFPPGPPPRRGITDSLGYYYRFATDPIGFVAGRFDTYGDIYYAPSRDGGLYVLKHPAHLGEVLVTNAARFDKQHTSFRMLSRFLGAGLLTSDGETWKRQRRMVQPAFARARLAAYASIMSDEAARAADRLRDGEIRDVGHEMMELTLRVVSRTLFGHDVQGEVDEVARAMVVFQESVGRPDVFPPWFPWPPRTKLRRAVESIDRIIHGMIERRKSAPVTPESADLLGLLLAAVDEEGDGGRLTARGVCESR